ncbi:MAG: TolC family protein, partial [Gammaproteobacteria bacterium]
GLAQAEVYDAARLSNPRFSLAWLDASGRSAQVTLGLAQNLVELLSLSPRRRIAEGALARTQQEAAAALVNLAADVEAAWVRHVAALAARELARAIAEVATTSADFAAALHAAGNLSPLARDRERAAAEALALDAVRAEAEVAATRAGLAGTMGHGPEIAWTAPAALPLPVAAEDDAAALARTAEAGRLDLIAARREVAVLEDALGLARSTRWLGDTRLGVEHEREPDGGRLSGPTLELELPIFNHGAGKLTRAAARLDAARAQAEATALAVGNEVAAASAAVAARREVVQRLRERVLPLREAIVAGASQMQHYMLLGQFDVLADKLAQYQAARDYLAALGDYWLARAALARAIGAPLPSGRGVGAVAPASLLDAPAAPAPAHSRHHAAP